MRILLVGEYSGLHNTLKQGLTALGHKVYIVGDGDGFKQFPVDYSIAPKYTLSKFLNVPRQAIFRLFKYDIAKIERGLRFYVMLNKFKGYDVVQLINEAPVKTTPGLEKFLVRQLAKQNSKMFLLCCGVDYLTVQFMLNGGFRYSLMDPYFNDKSLISEYRYILGYASESHRQLHDVVFRHIDGVIASDMDYHIPMQGHPKYLGLVPNPVNLERLSYIEPVIDGKIIIFLGINRFTYNKKGIVFFEEALKIVEERYAGRIEIIIAENVPYHQYINLYNKAHILLDQVYAYDQGYNALEAMAKGKVVFTGAEKQFNDYYGLTGRVAINALPDAAAIAAELSALIENPEEIITISRRARAFIEREHDHVMVAGRYVELWNIQSLRD